MDVSVVKSVVEDAKREYTEKAKVRTPNVTIDNVHLPPPPTDSDPHRPSWYFLLCLGIRLRKPCFDMYWVKPLSYLLFC